MESDLEASPKKNGSKDYVVFLYALVSLLLLVTLVTRIILYIFFIRGKTVFSILPRVQDETMWVQEEFSGDGTTISF